MTVQEGSWEVLPVFRMLEQRGGVRHREMFNIFNMGIGMVLAVNPADAGRTVERLGELGERASVIGRVTDSEGVEILPA